MKALVTGIHGFLGRHFAAELRTRGYQVYGMDVKDGPQLTHDCLTFFNGGAHHLPIERYDLVIHCAAVVGGREAIDGRAMDLSVNFDFDLAYARWLLRVRPAKAVFISSSAVYPVDLQRRLDTLGGFGFNRGLKLTERDVDTSCEIGVPDQIYGWTKLVGEELMSRVRAAGVDVTVVRPFSGYGGDQDLTYPFPTFVERALACAADRERPFEVWGSGEQVRDFIHVSDVVNGTLAAVDSDVAVVNLCTGTPTSFNRLAQQMLVIATGLVSPPNPIVNMPEKPAGVDYRVGDPEKMLTIYQPKVDLAEGIIEALNARRVTT